jgi:hypothetical protein
VACIAEGAIELAESFVGARQVQIGFHFEPTVKVLADAQLMMAILQGFSVLAPVHERLVQVGQQRKTVFAFGRPRQSRLPRFHGTERFILFVVSDAPINLERGQRTVKPSLYSDKSDLTFFLAKNV